MHDLKKILNKNLISYIEETFFSTDFYAETSILSENLLSDHIKLHKSLEILDLDWSESLKKKKLEILNRKEPIPLYFLPLLSYKSYELAYKLLLKSLILNKVYLKVEN